MNALGLMLLGSIIHATGFAMLGILVYLGLRRRGPAAGSLAAGSTLLIMVLVSLIVLSPWPRWWTVAPESFARNAVVTPKTAGPTEPFPTADEGSELRARSASGAPKGPPLEATEDEIADKPTFLALLLEELRRPATGPVPSRWGWAEWLAVGFLASLALGLIRLGLGLWGMRRLRARSVPIDDRELHDAIEILRAELSCTRPVAVRELAELATPATIGWRRPLLLLPADWRDWSPDERRAVLAHELAHVRRGDFLAGLAAQLGLALHFYHPLAHWLAARLRLEQELAADAWGARLSGGKPSYLATLAQMALRRDSRAMTWPARAFLPSHGTFIRRIEMLRNTKQIRPGSPSLATRALTIGVLAAMGLFVAGLRGPVRGMPVSPAQEQPEAQPEAAGPQDALQPYNLAFLPVDTKMILAIQPAGLARRRDVQSLLNSMRQAPSFQMLFLVPPEDIAQLVVFWDGSPLPELLPRQPALIAPPAGLVLRTTRPQDWKSFLRELRGQARRPIEEGTHDGQTYLRLPVGWGLYMADGQTLVAAREEILRELIEDRKVPAPNRPWDEAWKKVTKGQVMLALETRWLRRRIAQAQQRGRDPQPVHPGGRGAAVTPQEALVLKFQTLSPLWEKARSYAMGILANDKGLTVDLVAGAGSDQDAKPVAETLQAMVTLGKNAAQGLRQEFPHPAAGAEGLDWLLQAAGSLLEKAQVETSEGFVHLGASAPIDLAEGIRVLKPAVRTARAEARRFQSVNNIKQIGLAFHNYHNAKGHFPAAVNYGGKSKKVPYSWRVAILPYLEQQELYNAYNFDEPWDGPNNRKLIDKMPATYSYPGVEGTLPKSGYCSYFAFTGPSTALSVGAPPGRMLPGGAGMSAIIQGRANPPRVNSGQRQGPGAPSNTPPAQPGNAPVPDGPVYSNFTDGTSNTIMAVEARREIPWTKPEDIPFDPRGAPNVGEVGGFTEEGFNALFADGSVRYIKRSINPIVLKALITRDAGEVISSDSY
jgi:prepilin-type processing-associated H-X9-DG protein